jgi:hypothetical protein
LATKHWLGTTTSFNTASNWSDGNAPANSDTLIFNHFAVGDCTTNLSTVLTGVTLIIEKSFSYDIGTLTSAGVATYLVLDGGTMYNGQESGQGSPTGSTTILVNFGSTAATVYMYDSASTGMADNYFPPVAVKGTSLTLYQTGGSLAIAPFTGETATLAAGTVTRGEAGVSPSLYLGSGVTQTALTAKAGEIFSRTAQTAAATTINGTAIYTVEGTGAHTAITLDGNGRVNYGCTGTVGTLTSSGEWNSESYAQPYTITNRAFGKGARYFIDNGRSTSVTQTNAYTLTGGASLQDIQVRLPPGKTL